MRVELTEGGEVDHGQREIALTESQRQLAAFLLMGRKDREIAELTGRSLPTVKSNLRTLYALHRVRSRRELLARLA